MRAKYPPQKNIKLIERQHQQPEEKTSVLENRTTCNNLRFSDFNKKAEGAET